MSAQIIHFPRAKKPGVVPDERSKLFDELMDDLMSRLQLANSAHDDLDERFNRFLLKTGIIKETNR